MFSKQGTAIDAMLVYSLDTVSAKPSVVQRTLKRLCASGVTLVETAEVIAVVRVAVDDRKKPLTKSGAR